jgi:hypothetical protein
VPDFLIVILLVGVAAFAAYHVTKARARGLLGPIQLEVTPESPELGRDIEVKLTVVPTGRIELNRVRLGVRGYEWIQWRETETSTDSDGKSRSRTVTRSKTHDVFHERETLRGQMLTANAGLAQVFRCSIPRDAPPSFAADDNAIRWEAYVEFDIAGLPDVREVVPLGVLPRFAPEEVSHG